MSAITTHVLDVSGGSPAAGMAVTLEARGDGGYREIARGVTDDDGRCKTLLPAGEAIEAGVYRITFDTGAWFKARDIAGFYPEASIAFEVRDGGEHYHVPLLLSPFGYSTYRGS